MLDGTWEIYDKKCLFEKMKKVSDGTITDLNREQTLFRGYHEIKYALQITYSPSMNLLDIIRIPDGTLLRNLL